MQKIENKLPDSGIIPLKIHKVDRKYNKLPVGDNKPKKQHKKYKVKKKHGDKHNRGLAI